MEDKDNKDWWNHQLLCWCLEFYQGIGQIEVKTS